MSTTASPEQPRGGRQDQQDGQVRPTLQELREEAHELFRRIERHLASLGKGRP